MQQVTFVHLQCQTVYSLLQSACKIEPLVRRAKELGFQALAITDQNVMYGVIPFYKACKAAGIHPIIGLTASVSEEEASLSYPLVLLAETETGYRNLLKISSVIMTKTRNGIPKKWLSHYAEGLIAISPGVNGEVEQLLLQQENEQARKVIAGYKEMFSSFYLSIQNHGLSEERLLQARLLQLSEDMNVPLVAANNVHYVDKTDAFVQDCLLCAQHGVKVEDTNRPRLRTEEYDLKSAEQMEELFSFLPEALDHTVQIAQRCRVEVTFHESRLPEFPIETGETSDEFLQRICEEGLRKRYERITDVHRERLQHELRVISRMGFSDYFLIVWDFMKYAHSLHMLTGPGRGSAAGSLVAYVLEITNIDPIQYRLLFERFLNPERLTMPDIDIDFPDVRRDEIISYVAKKYGQLHAAQIITFGTLAAKAAVRDIGRVMGLSQREMEQFSRLIPSRPGITLEQAYEDSAALREYTASNPTYERVFSVAKRVEGIPRHTSIHAAGVILSATPLTNSVAVQQGHNDVYITQYPAETLEELGLLKIDFLGLRNLTILENICSFITEMSGEMIDLQRLPLDDEATFSLLGQGDTTGVFQLESSGMRNVLKALQPTAFEDIVAVNALYRPGPMEQIPIFIEAKHGKRAVEYLHPDLEPILKKTYGVVVYQEQIMEIASKMAGFSLGEADLLRRAVSKKKHDILEREREPFVKGCLDKGYDEGTAQAVYDLIVRFANYGFNRSHAVAYSMIAYQLAYLKANYSLAFTAALLTSALGNEERLMQYVREAKRKNIQIFPPSIQTSDYRFYPEEGGVRYSLLGIRGIGSATVRDILQERRKGAFTDLFQFCVRLPSRTANRKHLELLIGAGCLDCFGVERASLLASIDAALEYAALVRPDDANRAEMFLDEELVPKPAYTEAASMSFAERLRLEKETLGLYVSGYPTQEYEPLIQELQIPTLSEAIQSQGKNIRSIVFVTEVKVIRTKAMQNMAFLTICDRDEELEAVVFPDMYAQFRSVLQEDSTLLLEGAMSVRNSRKQWVVSGVYTLGRIEEYEAARNNRLYIKLPSQYDKGLFAKITKTLLHYPGLAQVFIYYEKEHKMVQLSRPFSVHPNEECIKELKEISGTDNVALKM